MDSKIMEVKPEEFLLSKIQFHPKKGVNIEGLRKYTYGSEANTKDVKGFDDRLPQPAFSQIFRQDLRKYAAMVEYDTNGTWLISNAQNQGELAVMLKQPLEKQMDQIIKGIVIHSIKKTGEGEWVSVVIEGTRTLHTGKTEPFKTPAINLKGELYGWEQDLIEKLELLEHEAFQYVFRGACGDPTLFDLDGNPLDEGGLPEE